MGFYMRVLTPNARQVPLKELEQHIEAKKLKVKLELNGGKRDEWRALMLVHSGTVSESKRYICGIERNSVMSKGKDTLGASELEELIEEAKNHKPVTASRWLKNYLPKVKTIYAFEVYHSGAEYRKGWDALRSIRAYIWQSLGGVGHVDYEGFSNEAGCQITWDFSDDVESWEWQSAVLDKKGNWNSFVMDLANVAHQRAFQAGCIPKGVKRL